MLPFLSMAAIIDQLTDEAICGPLVIPRCIPATLATSVDVVKDFPWSVDVAQNILSFLPKVIRITPFTSFVNWGCAPLPIVPVSGFDQDKKIKTKKANIPSIIFIFFY